ncbi:MAG: hypothetical protein ACXWQO_10350 [Bdellovibrionota bacterium]
MKKIILPALVFLGPVSAMAETIQLDCGCVSSKLRTNSCSNSGEEQVGSGSAE